MKIPGINIRRIRKQSIKIISLLLAVIVGTVQTGCGTQSPVTAKSDNHSAKNGIDAAGNLNQTGNKELVPIGALDLVPANPAVNEQAAGNNTVVTIGSLVLTLPLGWKMEQRVSEEGMAQYVLIDIHSEHEGEVSDYSKNEIEGHGSIYEHEIVITPYEIARMPELTLQLAAEMKEYFPVPLLYGIKGTGKTEEIKGCWMCGENPDTLEEEYFLFSENSDGKKELLNIREGNSSITACNNDIEAFWRLMDEELVQTDEGSYIARQYTRNTKPVEYYFLFNNNATDYSLLMTIQTDSNEMSVYKTGDYEIPLSVQHATLNPEWLEAADINQDGYEDFLCRSWLLDQKHSLDFSRTESFEGYLWDEENNTFVYMPGEQMLEQHASFWEDRQKEENGKGSGQIPDELTTYLSEYLLQDRAKMRDAMLPLISDREMSLEEITELADSNIDIKNCLLEIASTYQGSGIWLETDADNDGINDIFLCEYLGGTLHIVYYSLFTGREDGSYELTDCHSELQKEFSFIQWEGKNYLAKTTWEFTKKEINGISLECYENGKYQGGVRLAITAGEGADARDIQTAYAKDGQYQSLKNTLEEFAGKHQSGSKVPHGTAEEEKKDANYPRSCDIDNDGEMEEYKVTLWTTSNYYTVDHLSFAAAEESLTRRIYDIINGDEAEEIPMYLWVDETEYGNVTYILYEDGLYDFHISGYLLSESDSRKLLQTDCHVQTGVTLQEMTEPDEIHG